MIRVIFLPSLLLVATNTQALDSLAVRIDVDPAATLNLRGTVTRIRGTGAAARVEFRTARENYTLKLNDLPAATRTALQAPTATTQIISVSVPGSAVDGATAQPMGIRSDCSELPLGYNALEAIAQSGGVTDINSFLAAIPEGTLQGFTFVTNSQSAQNGSGPGEVNERWPRVLRSSADGRLTMSYVCNPASEAYNTVEVIYWDDASRSFKTASFNFRPPTPGSDSNPPRTERNPRACATCHSDSNSGPGGTPSIHPNWPEYFFWGDCQRNRGITFYGSSDDNMDPDVFRGRLPSSIAQRPEACTDALDRAAHRDESRDFLAFRAAQANNPCYSSLPWARIPADRASTPPYDQYRFYPYAVSAQRRDEDGHFNYSLRTNARFTDTYSHLMAQRLQRLMESNPDYERIKYYLAMEGAGCLTPADDAQIRALVPGLTIRRDPDPTNLIARKAPHIQAPLLYSFSQYAGLAPGDWSMEFNQPNNPSYNAVMFAGSADSRRDWAMADVVQGDVLQGIAATNPAIRTASTGVVSRGITEEFGERFSCIDDMGGGIARSARGPTGPLCQALRAENTRHIARFAPRSPTGTASPCPPGTESVVGTVTQATEPVARVLSEADRQSIARGRDLSTQRCAECHGLSVSGPTDFKFIPGTSGNSANFRNRVAEGDFLPYLRERINSGEMPPGGPPLNATQRQDILNYFDSLATP